MIGLCLGLAGVAWAQLPISGFTLAWNHTIEKIRWEEDYRVSEHGLVLMEARVKGSGAGMEVPAEARFEKGSWHYRRDLPPLQPLKLGRAPQAGDYQLCFDQQCHEMSKWVGPPASDPSALELWSCRMGS